MRIRTLFIVSFLSALVLFVSCKRDKDEDTVAPTTDIYSLDVSDDFDWKTTKNISLHLEAQANDGSPLSGVRMYVYDKDPGDGEENPNSAHLIYSGFTDASGVFDAEVRCARYLDRVYVKPQYIGLEEKVELELVNGAASYTFGGKKTIVTKGDVRAVKRQQKGNLVTLGGWDNKGKPDYLTTSDNISASLLADVNASLPEYAPLTQTHPQYLVDGAEANLELTDSCDIWVTFVHEGAGYRNVLGYYTYQVGNEPTSTSDLTDMTVIFPNVSFNGSGGGLNSGDKVHIGRFGAGTVIGWFIIANGYNYSQQQITGNTYYYSNPDLNPESTSANRKHMVLLKDDVQDLLIMGFEDINREAGNCDHDFNDAIFYATANPITAVQTTNVPQIDTPGDQDNDGVSDRFDDYPNDANHAMNNYYPSDSEYGTLAFEDMWPQRGDYDFNDLVVDYRFNSLTNGENKVVAIEAELVVRAIGAGFHNGFGWQMELPSSGVSSVTGYVHQHSYITLNGNGTESNQTKANIIAFDNAFYVLQPNGGSFVNTVVGDPYVDPDTLRMRIDLNTPQDIANVGYPPYNPYLIVDKERGKEVHLPGYEPTQLANTAYFGTGDDNTNVAQSIYYRSNANLPWGMNLPSSFVYPREKSSILQGHLMFGQWAQSSGFSYMDWYEDNLGYRNTNHLYQK